MSKNFTSSSFPTTSLTSSPSQKSLNTKDELLLRCRETIESLNDEIENQKQQRREVELYCKEIELKNQSLETKIKELNFRTNSLSEENEKILNQKNNLEQELGYIKRNDGKYSQKIGEVQSELEKEKTENISLKQQLNEKVEALRETSGILQGFEMKIKKLEEQIDLATQEAEEWRQKYEDAEFKCDRLTSQVKIAEAVIQNLKKAQEDCQSSLQQEKQVLQQREKEMKEKYQNYEQKIKKMYMTRENELKQELKKTIEEIQQGVELSSAEYQKTRNENLNLKEIIKKYQDKEFEYQNVLKDTSAFEAEIANLQKIIEELNEKLISGQQKYQKHMDSYNETEKTLYEKLEIKEKEIESLKKELNNCVVNLEENLSLKLLLEEQAKQLKIRDIEIQRFLSQEKEYEYNIAKMKENHLQELKKLSYTYEDKIDALKSTIKQKLRKEFEDLVDKSSKASKKLEIELNELKTKVKSQENVIEELEKEKEENEIYRSSGNFVEELENARKTIGNLELEIKYYEDENNLLNEKIKQDSSLYKREMSRKDDEILKMKRKIEAWSNI
ncbi:unnamed protein product [Blepharisma stoltei]|uniref:Uncharacterized protein n=1 Tax=Blepharisma stoltei TaxID=1481888 RepID=A0AAU9JE83_9CILI|nr:unnamed protein product [Blepharisma stoltei]